MKEELAGFINNDFCTDVMSTVITERIEVFFDYLIENKVIDFDMKNELFLSLRMGLSSFISAQNYLPTGLISGKVLLIYTTDLIPDEISLDQAL